MTEKKVKYSEQHRISGQQYNVLYLTITMMEVAHKKQIRTLAGMPTLPR